MSKRSVFGVILILFLTCMQIFGQLNGGDLIAKEDYLGSVNFTNVTPLVEGEERTSSSYTCISCTKKPVSSPDKVNGFDYSVHICGRTETVEDHLQSIRDAISQKGVKWFADETSVSRLTLEERKLLCGARARPIPEGAKRLPMHLDEIPFGTFDWRNVDGISWMTSVKDQGACGSCWAFGTLGSLEAVINIVEDDHTIDMDLSEQFLVSCCDECGDCSGGYPYLAYEYIKNNGIPDESCFPYVASNAPCDPCADWENRAWIITDWNFVSNDPDSIKFALQTYGPLGVAMRAPDDFLFYKSGIYEPVWSSPEWDIAFPFGQANHWVTLVGYDDSGEYWIVKNSWGSSWGEAGYGKIAYGVLEQYDYTIAIISAKGPPEHDLTVSVEAPSLLMPGSHSMLNATVQNQGAYPETDVELYLLVNGTVVNSVTIPELVKGTSYTIDYPWTPTVEASYNITAYSPPVSGEDIIANNIASKIALVRTFPAIIVVDDDDGTSYVSGTSLPEFEAALTDAGYDYWVWSESSMGNPPLDLLTKFKLVVWTCGDYYGWAVDPIDAETLESYVIHGGSLFLEGEDIGFDHRDDDFMTGVAHAIYQVDETGALGLTVTCPTHPVVNELPASLTWAIDPPFDDGVTPANVGMDVIQYSGTDWTAVTVFEGALSKVVYFAFPLYCLGSSAQETLATNSVNWLLEPPRTFGWVENKRTGISAESERRPSMGTDSNGHLYVAYEKHNPDSGFDEIYVSKSIDNGDTWSTICNVYDDHNLGHPSIAIDVGDNNNLYVAFEREWTSTDHDIFVLRRVAGNWEVRPVANTLGSDDRYPSVTSEYQWGTEDWQYISYEYVYSSNDRDLMFAKSTDDGATWSIKKLHGEWPDGNVYCQTSITATRGSDGGDYIYIAYKWGADYNTAYDIVVDKSTDYGNTWTQQWVCDESSRDKNWPSITATRGGDTVAIAWHVYWDSMYLNDIQYAYSRNNGDSWNVEWLAFEADVNEETPVLTVDGQDSTSALVYGCVHVVYWRDNEIYHREATYSSPWLWTAAEAVTDPAAYVSGIYTRPAITTYRSSGGRYLPAVAWTNLNGSGHDIYYSTKGPQHIVGSNPQERTVEIDNEPYTTPASFYWIEGSSHLVNVPSPQYEDSEVRYIFENWSDGNAQSHIVIAGLSDQNITACFNLQYHLLVATNPSGLTPQPIVIPPGGWYNNGTSVDCTAQDVGGCVFDHWALDETNQGQGVNPLTITMNEPHEAIACYVFPPTTPVVVSPNGGETWSGIHEITWEASFDPDGDLVIYEIEYSYNGGATWNNLASGISGTFYSWDTKFFPDSVNYLIRVRAYDGGLYSDWDASDHVFKIDNSAPTIIGHKPTGTKVSATTTIAVTFNEAMNKASAESAFSIFPSVSGSFGWSGNEMTFTPSSNLAYNVSYTVTFEIGAEDLAGNHLQSPCSWQFKTMEVTLNQPTLLMTLPTYSFSSGESTTITVTVFNPTNTLLNTTLTIQINGPDGYYHFDSIRVVVDVNSFASHILTWTIPSEASMGTYTVEAGLIPPVPSAYDVDYVEIK